MNNLDQLLRGAGARIVPRRFRVDDMLPDMAFDHLGDEPVKGTAASGRLLQHRGAAGFLLKRTFNGVELATNAPDPVQQLLLVLEGVCHFLLDPILQGSIYARKRRVSNLFVPARVQQP